MTKIRNYKVGIYTRISKDNGDTEISESIENQKEIIKRYADSNRWQIIKYYTDINCSGTNFERPALKEMLKDAEDKVIDLILVKDLSRLGRNYLLIGELLDVTLPQLGCRLIAVNNNVDTLELGSAAMNFSGFINLFNQQYSRNTSDKVKSVHKNLAKQGKFLGTYVPYGYIKNPENKYELIPDRETAPIVKEIFEMCARGKSCRSIAVELNQRNVPSHRSLYYIRQQWENIKTENGIWNTGSVRGIIHNEVYIGTIIQQKKGTASFKDKRVKIKPQDEWIRVENTHEAIIDKKLWDTVCKMSKNDSQIKQPKSSEPVSIFVGLLRCGDCGFHMRSLIGKRTNKAGEENCYVSFMCNNYSRSGKGACTMHSISERKLKQWVVEDIQKLAKLANKNQDKLLQIVQKEKASIFDSRMDDLQKKYSMLVDEIKYLEDEFQQIFENKVKDVISVNKYKEFLHQHTKHFQNGIREKKKIENLLSIEKEIADSMLDWIEKIKQYEVPFELTSKILAELVDHINIYEKSAFEGKRNIGIVWRNIRS